MTHAIISVELMKEGRKVTFTSDHPLKSEVKDAPSIVVIERPFQNFIRIVREIFCFGQKRTETHIPESGAVEGTNAQLSPLVAQNGKFSSNYEVSRNLLKILFKFRT